MGDVGLEKELRSGGRHRIGEGAKIELAAKG